MNISWDIVLLICALLAVVLFVPRSGILARLRRDSREAIRILREDALKHVYHCEYSGIACTPDSLAGALGLKRNAAVTLTEELGERRLISYGGTEITLTDAGRAYALSIVRLHRLWERYLSDETTVQELRWHEEAEKQEHRLSDEEARALAKRLGQPLFDPHGDPIPGPGGTVPEQKGKLLRAFSEEEVVRILHVEDEPAEVYAKLVALRLFPGTTVRITESTAEKMIIEMEGRVIELTIGLAANITARRVPTAQLKAGQRTLASLTPGSEGTVSEISPGCRGLQRRRLMDLGVIPGTRIGAEMKAVGGDPTAYRVRGAVIALRRRQAEQVFLKDEEKAK
ncbi:MAG TPA: metal-dependent transcriptional regulator [Bacteroidota bacterium]|nr:metal-dependent transcriptional regulator [Bacteroidota bacterium]